MECHDLGDEKDANSSPIILKGGFCSKNHKCIGDLLGPKISIQAITGSPIPRMMKVLHQVNGVRIVILIDTRSTYNFVDPSVIVNVHLLVQTAKKLLVMVANGVVLSSEGLFVQVLFHI